MLLEQGKLSLHDRAADFVPRFAQNGKQDVRILHLLTRTSGLPDMLPNNELLRRQHQPFSTFIDEICRLPLAFEPGTRVLYQSMGIALLAEIVHQVSGQVLPEFLRRKVFQPLGMSNTWLGLDPSRQPGDGRATDGPGRDLGLVRRGPVGARADAGGRADRMASSGRLRAARRPRER